MKQVVFAVPGDLSTPTGGYVYDRRIVAELPKSWVAGRCRRYWRRLSARRRPAERATAHAQLAALPAGRLIVIDGLAFGVMAETAEALHRTHRLVALGPPSARARNRLARMGGCGNSGAGERLALSFARRVVTTSATTARLLSQISRLRRTNSASCCRAMTALRLQSAPVAMSSISWLSDRSCRARAMTC